MSVAVAAVNNYLPPLSNEEYAALKASIAQVGVQQPVVVDAAGQTVDGVHRRRVCDELQINCPTVVMDFANDLERLQFVLAVHGARRQLSREQRRDLIAEYLRRDPRVANNSLAAVVGVSSNTVAGVREDLEATFQIEKFDELRGADGRFRPRKYKSIVAATPGELERACRAMPDLPVGSAGRTLDVFTATRRANSARRKTAYADLEPACFEHDQIRIEQCRFQELQIEPGTADLICTDIPYEGAFLDQLDELAQFATRVLRDGGVFLTVTGHRNLAEYHRVFGRHLTFVTEQTLTWQQSGSVHYLGRLKVASRCKPVLVFSKGAHTISGRTFEPLHCESKEKGWHRWQQSVAHIRHLVMTWSRRGDLVVDPCGGGFTTAVACHQLERRFIGCDLDPNAVNRGRLRLHQALSGQPDVPPDLVVDGDQSEPVARRWSWKQPITAEPTEDNEWILRDASGNVVCWALDPVVAQELSRTINADRS